MDIFRLVTCCTADEIKQEFWDRLTKPFIQRMEQLQGTNASKQGSGRHVRYNSEGEEITDVIVIDDDDDEKTAAEELPDISMSTYLNLNLHICSFCDSVRIF